MKQVKFQILHEHFKECPSTQIFLKDNIDSLLKKSKHVLISTEKQTNGIGQRERTWKQVQNALAFSFTFSPLHNMSLASLFVGNVLISFLKEKYDKKFFLKWPNDILNSEKKKCAGILCHYLKRLDIAICGIGINLGNHDYKEFSCVDSSLKFHNDDYQNRPFNFYEYFLEKRSQLNEDKIISEFEKNCLHINKQVLVQVQDREFHALFIGVDTSGQAIFNINNEKKIFNSARLFLV